MGVCEVTLSNVDPCPPAPAPAPPIKAAGPTTPGAGADVVTAAPPARPEAPPLPPPAGKGSPFPAWKLRADGTLSVAAGTNPLNTDLPFNKANIKKPGLVASEIVNLSVTYPVAGGDNTVTVAGGVNASQATLPSDSEVAYKGGLAVEHVFNPLVKVGLEGTLYGTDASHVQPGDPRGAGYRYGQVAATVKSHDTTEGGTGIDAGVAVGDRVGDKHTDRLNVAMQGKVTKPVGQATLVFAGDATLAYWTDPPPKGLATRMDVLGRASGTGFVSLDGGGNVQAFVTLEADARFSSQDNGRGSKDYLNLGVVAGLKANLDGESK